MTDSWLKVKPAAQYAGVSVRTFREFLKSDLRHVRLPSGTILTRRAWIDQFYGTFEADPGRLDAIVDDVLADFDSGSKNRKPLSKRRQ